MTRLIRIGVAALALAAANPAFAGDSQDFSGCDGRMKPKSKDDGMRGEASTETFSYFGSMPGNQSMRIEACNRALANPKLLPTQALRRAHLLRARAASYLEAGKTTEALTDLDAAEAANTEHAQDPLYRRSMGVSLLLLRAIATAQGGDPIGAAKLAEDAQALRPYALQVQMAAATIRHTARPNGARSPSPWGMVAQIDPGAASTMLLREAEIGNFAQVVALAKARPIILAGDASTGLNAFSIGSTATEITTDFGQAAIVAYAQAATGDVAAAKATLAAVRSKIDAFGQPQPAAPALPGTLLPPSMSTIIAGLVEPYLRVADARIALAESRPADALTSFESGKLVLNYATVDLLQQLRASPGITVKLPAPEELTKLLEADREKSLGRMASVLLIAPESQRTLIDYQKSRPNILGALVGGALTMGISLLGGIERTAGFRSSNNPDGTVKIEYVGNTSSAPMVQEMTLLRAAELARAAGKSAFMLVDRKDYSRYMVTSMGGMERSRTPIGFKTELVVRYLDDAKGNPAALDVVSVIDALGPFYYQN